ncbi:TIR domain-containing protein [Hymenobacter psychrotolerans]|uniref:ADP-ribosyl cyclase/cyclic ADP-ribose hydrolase n=1 Tax=Hymenobacter psychrotolerans DSM 18569 TaxID=1121959 RepID=A0A1M7DCI0_9BACT|nr:TIR domain-containing protein [Hymenobacter psychrotolerans]SHL77103.1 TIR domain-containing protein [Hymenobacter psychrotolerans DSM 18569]
MTSTYYYSQVAKLEKESAELQKKIADETKRDIDKQKEIESINRSITSTTSISTLQSKQSQIRSKQNDLVSIRTRIADHHRKLAEKSAAIATNRQLAIKEQQAERKKQQDAEKREIDKQSKIQQSEREKLKREQDDYRRSLQFDIDEQKRLLNQLVEASYTPNDSFISLNDEVKQYDLFISHASEDKEEFVRPLAEKLTASGIEVWYDEYSMRIGDSLRRKIDEGLKSSRFGLVILSSNFFKKNWPQHELDGLVAREMRGTKVILPIWHKVTRDEVVAQSPTLADKVALNSSIHSLDDIVKELKTLLDN